jgi:hypothetical protein
MKYWIDQKNRIAHVDEAWLEFAVTNGAPELTQERVRGRPLSMFVDDRTTSYLWSSILSRARRGAEVSFTIRCDAPSRRRIFLMHVTRDGPTDLLIRSESLSEEDRETVTLPESSKDCSEGQLRVCSWCKKVFVPPDRWFEVEEAVAKLDLLLQRTPPAVTHGICAACDKRVRAEAGLD